MKWRPRSCPICPCPGMRTGQPAAYSAATVMKTVTENLPELQCTVLTTPQNISYYATVL